MKNKAISLLSAAVLVLALGSMAKADSFTLGVQNGGLTGTGPWGTVTVLCNGGGTSCTIEFAAASGFEFHNGGVGWNVADAADSSITNTSVTTCTSVGGATCSLQSDTENSYAFDGFGKYDMSVTGGNGSSTGLTDIIITITGTGLTTADFEGNNGNAQFVAQVSPYPNPNGGCTGFVANENLTGNQPSATAGSGCGSTSVPEPGSLALFGTGILGMAGYLRRKLLS